MVSLVLVKKEKKLTRTNISFSLILFFIFLIFLSWIKIFNSFSILSLYIILTDCGFHIVSGNTLKHPLTDAPLQVKNNSLKFLILHIQIIDMFRVYHLQKFEALLPKKRGVVTNHQTLNIVRYTFRLAEFKYLVDLFFTGLDPVELSFSGSRHCNVHATVEPLAFVKRRGPRVLRMSITFLEIFFYLTSTFLEHFLKAHRNEVKIIIMG